MKLIKVFTLRFSEGIDGFNDENLRAFIADKQIISITEKFFFKDAVPYWTIIVVYKPLGEAQAVTEGIMSERKGNAVGKEDYRSIVAEADMPLFELLREWRNERARKESVPAYILFTNKQIAKIASKSPENLNQLGEVEGVGKSKIEKYGKDVLQIIQTFRSKHPKPIQTESPAQAEKSIQAETLDQSEKDKSQTKTFPHTQAPLPVIKTGQEASKDIP